MPDSFDHDHRSSLSCFTVSFLDRMSSRRSDESWIAEQLQDPMTRFVPLWRSRNFFLKNGDSGAALMTSAELGDIKETARTPILLGKEKGVVYFAVDLPPEDDLMPDKMADWGRFLDLRRMGTLLEESQASLLAYARAMTFWHRHHRFCGYCGGLTTSAEAGHMRVCTRESCGRKHFPRTDPAVIVLVTSHDKALLGNQAVWSEGRYSTIAGFVDPGETLEQAVVREALEETGIKVEDVRYHSSQPWPFPRSIMIGFTARAVNQEIRVDRTELDHADWFSRKDIVQGLKQGTLHLPTRLSIAYRLIEGWFNQGDCGLFQDHMKGAESNSTPEKKIPRLLKKHNSRHRKA